MRLNRGWALFEQFAATASEDDIDLVREAMLSLADGTWVQRFVHYDDVTSRRASVILVLHEQLWLVATQLADYPDYFNIDYIGSPDDR